MQKKELCYHRVHHYLVGEVIAQGSFSSVRSGLQQETFDPIAIKLTSKKKLLHTETGRSILFSEKCLAPLLNHPNIARTIEVFESQTHLFEVMELQTTDLITYLQQKRPGLDEKKAIADQILSAVSYLHYFHICHRDIKPDNILIGPDGICRLCDFGFTDISIPYSQNSFGSVGYAAPEVLTCDTYDGCAADLFSVGVLLYTLFANTNPFPLDKFLQNRDKKGKVHPSLNLDLYNIDGIDFELVPRPIAEMVRQLLSFDPSSRPSAPSLRNNIYFSDVPNRYPLELPFNLNIFESILEPHKVALSRTAELLNMADVNVKKLISEEGVSKCKIFYLLLCQTLLIPEQRLHIPSFSAPVNSPFFNYTESLAKGELTQNASFRSEKKTVDSLISQYLLSRKFCISTAPNGVKTAILNTEDSQITLEYEVKTLMKFSEIDVTSSKSQTKEAEEAINYLRSSVIEQC